MDSFFLLPGRLCKGCKAHSAGGTEGMQGLKACRAVTCPLPLPVALTAHKYLVDGSNFTKKLPL